MEETRVTDLTFLRHFTSGNTEMVKNLINVFFITAEDFKKTMEKEIAATNWGGTSIAAHSFKPQLSYMGIKSGEEVIKQIETDSSLPDAAQSVPSLFNLLKTTIDVAIAELREETKKI
jgi:HPt (histidine-containing phosphotransfer) domain-containing protein